MPVIVVGNEKNFAALRSRLFAGKPTPAAIRAATDAITAANPHADLASLKPGTVLTIPDVPNLRVRTDVSLDAPTKELAAGLVRGAEELLDELVAAAKADEESAAGQRKQLGRSLSATELASAARKDRTLGARLKATRNALAQEQDQAGTRATALDEARARWTEELKALAKLLA
jgi:hypothetical protein